METISFKIKSKITLQEKEARILQLRALKLSHNNQVVTYLLIDLISVQFTVENEGQTEETQQVYSYPHARSFLILHRFVTINELTMKGN